MIFFHRSSHVMITDNQSVINPVYESDIKNESEKKTFSTKLCCLGEFHLRFVIIEY